MDDDTPLHSWRAARSMGRSVAPGRLLLTRTHIVFEPSGRSASKVIGLRFSMDLKHLAAAGTAPGTGRFFSGGKAERLCLTMGDGAQWLFVVADAAGVAETIRAGKAKR
ncbi:MAG: hypothetical protein QM658_04380 [Gordonia sp. (in: high G+C Gram-positive bacteria)]